MNSEEPREEKKTTVIPSASAVLGDGELVEMVYDPAERRTRFVCGSKDAWRYEESVSFSPTERLVPYSPGNNLIKHNVVLFPSEVEEYGTEAELVSRIRDFVRRHVAVGEDFEEIATYYILFTWVHDAFDEVPYVRVRGGYGSGKTRFLLTVGSLCYKPIFASAASTVSPLFRLLDAFRGTLILDEGDFRYSDEKSEVVKFSITGTRGAFPFSAPKSPGSASLIPRRTTSSARRSSPRAGSSRTRRSRVAASLKTCVAGRSARRSR